MTPDEIIAELESEGLRLAARAFGDRCDSPSCGIAANLAQDAAAEITRLSTALADAEAKLERVRQILAGTAVGSLPNDYPVERLALETWTTLQERTLEGLAMIGKVEAAEANLVKAARLCEVEGNKLVEQEYELCSTLSFGTRLKRLAAAIRSLNSLTDTSQTDAEKVLGGQQGIAYSASDNSFANSGGKS